MPDTMRSVFQLVNVYNINAVCRTPLHVGSANGENGEILIHPVSGEPFIQASGIAGAFRDYTASFISANADRYEKEQAAEAIKAAGLAEAEAIRARGEANAAATRAQAEAEAEGLLKKAEAMKQYGEAATQQMQLDALKVYFEQLPKIAEAVGSGYQNVESIKMYGGDSSQLTGNMINTITQISDGLNESIGIDLKSVLAGFLGGRLANNGKEVAVNISEN